MMTNNTNDANTSTTSSTIDNHHIKTLVTTTFQPLCDILTNNNKPLLAALFTELLKLIQACQQTLINEFTLLINNIIKAKNKKQ